MQKFSRIALVGLLCLFATVLSAQVLLPEEVQEAGPHRLQLKYLAQLRAIGASVEGYKFPYNFYFSRTLDVSEQQQVKLDQRSIRFARYQGQTVLIITGNYFAAYSDDQLNKNARAKKTLDDVVLPIMKIAVPYFANDDSFDGFAVEISHHVRRKVMRVGAENAENVVYLFPRAAAQHLTSARTPDELQGALLESKVFIDATAFNLWVNGQRPEDQSEFPRIVETEKEPVREAASKPLAESTVSQKLIKPAIPARILTAKDLASLNARYSEQIARTEHDLAGQIHFAKYVPSQFVGFHEAAYLQLTMIYEANTPAETSRYKLAALAFDEHVSHLIRPICAHFQDVADFDGVVFSVVVKTQGKDSSMAVEFYLPNYEMRKFILYDASGQELIDSGFVLINGERATLNLQLAEAK